MTRRWLLAALAIVAVHDARAADATVATYVATYRVDYKGREAGTAELAVRYLDDRDLYEFSSRIVAKGFLKLVRPNPAVERSHFQVVANRIQPLEFWYEDGSRSGDDNLHIEFDWERRVATVSNAEARRELALPEAALDRGSLRAALMRDLAMASALPAYRLAEENSVAEYSYVDHGTETVTTAAGAIATRVLTQQRPGSSRATWLWVAPELRFLPVRIEQRRGGEVHTAFELVSVSGLTAAQ